MRLLVFIVAVVVLALIALAHLPANYRPPPLLEVWLNMETGEYRCEPGSRIAVRGTPGWKRRPGYSVKTMWRDVSRTPGARPCADCVAAHCFEIPYSMLDAVFNRVWGYRVRTKWLTFGDDDPNVRWMFDYHHADGTADERNTIHLEVLDDPEAWFR